MTHETIAILHYAGPPGIGGVEATIAAHVRLLADDGYNVRVIVGTGSMIDGREDLRLLPLLGSRHQRTHEVNLDLNRGVVSPNFHTLVDECENELAAALEGCAVALVHNAHTLHKNLVFTAALARLHMGGQIPRLVAWAHDFAWGDPLYLEQLHEGWPWNLLRTPWPDVKYVAVSHDRQATLADLLRVPSETITVVPPGVDTARLMKLEPETQALVDRYDLLAADPLLVLPARITRRKNIEGALRIVAALRDEGCTPILIVTGPPGPHNPTNAQYLAELQDLRGKLNVPVLFLYETCIDDEGRSLPVSDAMIADFLSLADGLLFPSRSEGFGMPVIEAALRAVPIFCANIPPFKEIAGSEAVYFALDESPTKSAHRIVAALRNDKRYVLRRRVLQEYTWQAIYRRSIKPLLLASLTM